MFLPAGGGLTRTSELPNPVSGSEVARWSRSSIDVDTGTTGMVSRFALVTDAGEIFDLEVTTALGGAAAYDLFINALRSA